MQGHGIINSFINDIFEKFDQESSRLARYNKNPTILSREIQTAVRLMLPRELAKHGEQIPCSVTFLSTMGSRPLKNKGVRGFSIVKKKWGRKCCLRVRILELDKNKMERIHSSKHVVSEELKL